MSDYRRRAAVALSVALLAAGCGSSRPGTLTSKASALLQHSVQQLREIAATGDLGRLQQAITDFDNLVERERKAGQISDTRATAIEDAADGLTQYVQPSSSTSTTSTTTTTTTSTSPSPSPTPTPTATQSASQSPSPTPTESSPSSVGVTISPP